MAESIAGALERQALLAIQTTEDEIPALEGTDERKLIPAQVPAAHAHDKVESPAAASVNPEPKRLENEEVGSE